MDRIETLHLTLPDGNRVVYDRRDGGTPALVYLHGLNSHRSGTKGTAVFELARATGRAVWRIDFRGHGASSGAPGDICLSELIADVHAVLGRCGPAVLIGTSLGGLIAAWTAALHPSLVIGVTLIAPALDFLPRLRSRSDADGGSTLDHASGPIGFSARVMSDFATFDEQTLPSRISTPIQIVHGEADELIPASRVRSFHAGIRSRKDLFVVPGGDHSLNAELPAILERIAEFHQLCSPG